MYFSGQGKLLVATPTNGVPGPFRWVGNVPELNFKLTTEILEHKESWSGQRLTDLRLTKSKSAGFTAQLESFEQANLALVLYGAASTINSGTVSTETFPNPVAVGDFVRLAHQDVSAVVITDSAGTPATLVANTDYRVSNADLGTIEILGLASYTQPFKAAYSYGAVTNVNMFTQAQPEIWMRFEGLNTAHSNDPVLVELYKVVVDPLEQMDMINDDIQKYRLSGTVLMDDTKVSDTTLGQFGRLVLL